MSGPLTGFRVVEIAGLGPGPFAAMMLADMGADVIRVDRPGGGALLDPKHDLLNRGKRSIAVNLKSAQGVELVLALLGKSDALIEGFRPGVMERLGLGPRPCLERNLRLVYGRVTGWGREGPLASAAGHDINYIALAGALHAFARQGQPPVPPVNTVGDFGGGGLLLAFGVVCALLEAQRSGRGQVVDAAMIDGSALLMTMIHGMRAMGGWRDEAGVNLLDTGAHFYEVYETKDGQHVALGAIEPRFYAELVRLAGLGEEFAEQLDPAKWPELKRALADVMRRRTRAEWCALLEGTEACFAPVLSLSEAPAHPHHRARGTFTEIAGVVQPQAAPRFDRTPAGIRRPPPEPGQHTAELLGELGWSAEQVRELFAAGAVAPTDG